jgi:hypothetical protein
MPTNALTTSRTKPEATQTAMVAELVERTLLAIGAGRAVVVSLDAAQRIVGFSEILMDAYGRMDHAQWELANAVSRKARAVVVGYHTGAPGEAERFARTIGASLPAPILELVVSPTTVRNPQVAASGWVRRSTVPSS